MVISFAKSFCARTVPATSFSTHALAAVICTPLSAISVLTAADEAPEENVDAGEQQIHEAIDAQENYFVPKAALKMPEEEPELFPNHNPAPAVAKPAEEMEELIVSENEPRRRSFIEIMTGRSIAKRNQQKQAARVQEPVAPSFADAGDDKVNLEIPSFLRRR